MYSRNRVPSAEERYRSNLPPVYSGSRFRYGRQEDGPGVPVNDARADGRQAGAGGEKTAPSEKRHKHPPTVLSPDEREDILPALPQALQAPDEAAETSETADAEPVKTEEETKGRHRLPGWGKTLADLLHGTHTGIGQEDLLLLSLLLLLSAEHERSMDVIIILLLLMGMK